MIQGRMLVGLKCSWAFCALALVGTVSVTPARAHSPHPDVPGIQATRNYELIRNEMAALAAANPGTVTVFELGKSDDNNRSIEGLRIGTGAARGLVVATHHGNEYGSTEVAMGVLRSLAANPIPDMSIDVIPVLNIYGYERGSRNEVANGRSYDPNRDYTGPCVTTSSFRLKSTRALADRVATEAYTVSATLHTYYPGVLYPWGISTHDLSTPYDGLFIEMGRAATIESRYKVGNSTEELYPADGTFEDYAFWKHGIWSLLFEMGYTHSPNPTQVAEMVRVNTPGIRRLMETAPRVRAEQHAFTGRCDNSLKVLDRRDE